MHAVIDILFWVTLIALSVTSSVVIYNFFTVPLLNKSTIISNGAEVSVLIPARNEASTIGYLLSSLEKQTLTGFEVIVLDDGSEDDTSNVVAPYLDRNTAWKLIRGKNLPRGWKGKNWACQQLANEAQGTTLVFIDADVVMSPEALSSVVNAYTEMHVALLSVFPSQIYPVLGSGIIIPLMHWFLLSFLPVALVRKSTRESFTAVNGQMLVVNREAYLSIGGHEAVKASIVEDMDLGRTLKRHSYPIAAVLDNNLVSCRMYRSYKDAFNGFSKNIFPGFDVSPVLYGVIIGCMVLPYLIPFFLILFDASFIVCIVLILAQRLLISKLSRQNVLHNLILHPLQMVSFAAIALNSAFVTIRGRVEWKGRRYEQ